MNMKSDFSGIYPPIASPCDEDDQFLPDVFSALAEHLFMASVHGLYVCGGTGDGYKMRLDERKQAAEIAVNVSRHHHRKVIVHVGSPSNSRDAIELAEHASEVGASAVASIPPASFSQVQLVEYYTDIARPGLPVFIYHVPSSRNPTVDDMVALLDIPGVIGLKATEWNLFFVRRILLARPDTVLFNGFDEMLVLGMLYGADGGIGTWYNIFPRLFLNIYDSVRSGQIERAVELQKTLLTFCDLAWAHGPAAVFEFLMQKKGLADQVFRRPSPALDRETQKRIEPELDQRVASVEAASAKADAGASSGV